MDIEEARKLLQNELLKFRARDYSELRSSLGNQGCWEVMGASGTTYQVEVDVLLDEPGKDRGNLRILGTIDDGTLRAAFKPVSEQFIVTLDGRVLD